MAQWSCNLPRRCPETPNAFISAITIKRKRFEDRRCAIKIYKINYEVIFDVAIESETVEFVPSKIEAVLVLGPIALSISELVAYKNTPRDGLGNGSHSFGSGSADDDQYPNAPLR